MDSKLIGESRNIKNILALIDQIVDTGLNILIQGETGVGKDLVVKNLYLKSNRAGKPLVKVNCAALPDTLLESEMFGYERGAFTGALNNKRGKFEQARGGILFLDEVGDMSFPLQSKLLHVLQGGDFTPLGSEKSIKTDAWVIAATNHNLEDDTQAGKFRNDLYYRLSTIKITIEPLRNRPEDIPNLIDFYIKKYASRYNGGRPRILSPETLDKLCAYHWPGNVRELQNVLKRIVVLEMEDSNIDGMLASAPKASIPGGVNETATGPFSLVDAFITETNGSLDYSDLSLKKIRKKAVDHIETNLISKVLKKTGWNRSRAARILQISYKTLLCKIDGLGLEPPPDFSD